MEVFLSFQLMAESASASSAPHAAEILPSVEVHFQGQTHSTALAAGSNPQWNQSLVFPFRPPNGQFVPAMLSQCQDSIAFNVFDNVTTYVENDELGVGSGGSGFGAAVSRRGGRMKIVEKRWHNQSQLNSLLCTSSISFTVVHVFVRLGRVTLPFTTLYLNECRVEGFFPIELPVLNLAYTDPASDKQPVSPSSSSDKNSSGMEGSFLCVYATLDPPLVAPSEAQTFPPGW